MKEEALKEKERMKEEALREKASKEVVKEKQKQIAAARRNANVLLRKSEKAYTAMNLTVQNPLLPQLPFAARTAFEGLYSEIKVLRDRATACVETDDVLDFAFDEANLTTKCAAGLKSEGLIRQILQQVASV